MVLALLKQQDMYGYQLVQEMARQSDGAIISREGSLYPVLYKLLEQKMISDRRELIGRRMSRIYYHLEPTGEAYLRDLMEDYQATSAGVFNILRGSFCPETASATADSEAAEA